jgi:predicted secreted hydrolase
MHPTDPRRAGREGFDHPSVLLVLLAVALALAAALPPHAPGERSRPTGDKARLELGPGPGLDGFARAIGVRPIVLPADLGPHFDYQTEWWYYTGNVAAADGRRFGFQLTFFRRGLSPGPPPDGPGLSSNQVYFAHFAIADVAGRRHVATERFSRGAGGLAGATVEPFAVWLEDWKAESSREGDGPGASGEGRRVRLTARDASAGLELDLELAATKPLVAHGDHGLSPKGDEPGNASYYVSYTRMTARGRLRTPGPSRALPEVQVAGEAWFDHEWSTSALGKSAVGWDWFSLQLDDGRELMLFEIREDSGGVTPASRGTLVERDGRSRRLSRVDASIEILDHWTSPESGGRYPSRWRVRVPSVGLDLVVEPWFEAQEVRTSFVYWEGAVRVANASPPPASRLRSFTGIGYVELTGYGSTMRGMF